VTRIWGSVTTLMCAGKSMIWDLWRDWRSFY